MKCVKGNKIIEIDKNELDQLVNAYEETVIDLGTGDGRFVYKNASANPKALFIGIDTLAVNMAEYSKRSEFRRHVTMSASMDDGQIVEVTIDSVSEYFEKTKAFLRHIRRMFGEDLVTD